MKNKVIKVGFLGGVGEIGKNMTVIEYANDVIIIDCGLTFPSQEMSGVDLVIPDVSYLIANKHKIKGLFLTHGHEDHIGAVPYLLREISVPVYGTQMTLALLESRIKEFGIKNYKFHQVKPRNEISAGVFKVEFINVNHSVSGSCALAVTTPVGVIVHSGDFKIDLTPINDRLMDITRLSEIGKRGCLLLLCESTNVERAGYSMSESVVGATLERLFTDNEKRRIIIATFSSNVQRLQQILNISAKFKRKVALLGRSLLNVVDVASKIGELTVPKGVLIDIDKIKNYPDKEITVVSTGSQGEPMSALTRMAGDDISQITIGANDTIIISATPIPGNERSIYQVINNLYKKGAEVVYDSIEKIHVSGHACQEELKILHSILKPKFFIPVHGEYRHLKKHAKLAGEMGMKENRIIIAEIGDSVLVSNKSLRKGDKIPAGSRFVDGYNIDDSTSASIRDRRRLAEDGFLIVLLTVSTESGEILQKPDVISRGVTLTDEQSGDIKDIVEKTVGAFDIKSQGDLGEVKKKIRSAIRNYLNKKSKTNPMILPLITEL